MFSLLRAATRHLIILLVLLLSLSACGEALLSPDEEFARELVARVDPQIQLQTDRPTYNSEQGIAYRVVNTTAKAIYFDDISFNLRIYQYDSNTHQWVQLNLTYGFSDRKVAVQPGIPKGLDNVYLLPPGTIPKTGMIRLAVVGWNNPQDPEHSKVAAYKDIEIQAPQ